MWHTQTFKEVDGVIKKFPISKKCSIYKHVTFKQNKNWYKNTIFIKKRGSK